MPRTLAQSVWATRGGPWSGTIEKDGKLFTADPRKHRILRTCPLQSSANLLGDPDQCGVPRLMAKLVVQALEAVHIDHQYRESQTVRLEGLKSLGHMLEKGTAVRDARERVSQGCNPQLSRQGAVGENEPDERPVKDQGQNARDDDREYRDLPSSDVFSP